MKLSWWMSVLCVALLGLGVVPQTWAMDAGQDSPVGRWKTIDDATGKAKSIVMISEENGTLSGRVQKLLNWDPNNPNPVCKGCSGAEKDKPVIGMRILWGMQKGKDGWSGGTILDPESGRLYKCLLSVTNGGAKLKVRGFIGFAIIGRTQYWDRE